MSYRRPWRLAGNTQSHLLVSGDDFGTVHVWSGIDTAHEPVCGKRVSEDVSYFMLQYFVRESACSVLAAAIDAILWYCRLG